MKTRNVEDAQLDFLISALSHGSFMSTDAILTWMKQQNDEVVSDIKQISLTELKGWSFRDDRIRHDSGKFSVLMAYASIPIIVISQSGINLLSINQKLVFLALLSKSSRE